MEKFMVDGTTLMYFVLGLVLLVTGAEILVRGAAQLAAQLGISPVVIGLTVVAFGTSAPEMAVSVSSALSGDAGADIALGNVVGSNIFNILFILGVSAVIVPLVVAQRLVRVDVPLMVAASVVMLLMAIDGRISRWDGVILFSGIVAYTVFAIAQSRKESVAVQLEYAEEYGTAPKSAAPLGFNLALIVAGLILLIWGSNWLVQGAVAIAKAFGVSEFVIGVTIVAAGTSLPEVATSVVAAIKGERDIAVGNVVGSNLFNLLAVLALAGLTAPQGIPVNTRALQFDIPVMLAVSMACFPVFFTGNRIARWEGLMFLGCYALYTSFIVNSAGEQQKAPTLTETMVWFVAPLSILTLTPIVIRLLRNRRL